MLLGQSTESTSAIRGSVSDQAGAGLAGATVIITNKATARVIRVVTSDTGRDFSSGPLQPGDYTVRVQAKGFKTGRVFGESSDWCGFIGQRAAGARGGELA